MDSESTTKERSGGLGMQLPGGLSRQMSAMSASEAKASWTMMNFSSNVSEVGPIDEEQWSFKRLRAFIEDRFQRQERMMERLSNQIRSLDKDSQSKVAATESMAFSEFSEGVQLPVPLEYTTTTNAPTENVAGDEPVHKIGSMGSLRSSPSHCPKPRANSGSILPRFSKKLTRGQSDVSALSRTSARITREQTHKALAVLNQKSVLSPVSGNSEAESPASVEAFRFGDLPTCLVESAYFSHVVQFVIMVNLILLGVEVQYSTWGRVPGIFSIINYVIVTFFVAELAVRLLAFGCRGFFFGPERLWNILDACIVVISLFETGLEIVLEAVSDPGNDQNSSYLRALRLARLARALRSVRVMRFLRYIAALRTIILSIISTLGPLIWTLALLVLLFYLFAVILTQMVTDYCRYELGAPNNAQCDEKVVNHWQDVPESMLTLFLSITGGLSWEEALKPLRSVGLLAAGSMVLYIVIAVLAVLNVVTGVFCHTAIESAKADKDVAIMKQMRTHAAQVQAFRDIFQEIDCDQSDFMTYEELQVALSNPKMSSLMQSMDISTQDVWTLFMVLDNNGDGQITLDEFVYSCMQLQGPAKGLQLARMSYENSMLRDEVIKLQGDFKTFQTNHKQSRHGDVRGGTRGHRL